MSRTLKEEWGDAEHQFNEAYDAVNNLTHASRSAVANAMRMSYASEMIRKLPKDATEQQCQAAIIGALAEADAEHAAEVTKEKLAAEAVLNQMRNALNEIVARMRAAEPSES